MRSDTKYDVLIVGGGPAGAAAAIELARAGRSVVLLEREPFAHDKVCGEFLSHEAVDYLQRLGLDPVKLSSVPITQLRLERNDRPVLAKLPFPAQSLSRRVLDDAMLAEATKAGADVRRGVRVTALTVDESGYTATVADGPSVDAATAFLATGKHDVRGWKRPPGLQNGLIGFKMHWHLSPRQKMHLDRTVELALFNGGYAGLEPVEDGRANLCLLVDERVFAGLDRSWAALLAAIRTQCPSLNERLTGAAPCTTRPLAIFSIPFGYVRKTSAGPWHLGDQAAVIPSFSGDGISIALHSARLASKHYLEGDAADAYQRELYGNLSRQIRLSTRLSQALLTPWGQRLAIGLSAFAPALLVSAAHTTRIPRTALDRAVR